MLYLGSIDPTEKDWIQMIQTWLPLPSFENSIAALHINELKMQRLHVIELLEFFHDPEESSLPLLYEDHGLTDDHSLVQMWRGYELQLIEYGMELCEKYGSIRGKPDPLLAKLSVHLDWANTDDSPMTKPNWFGDIDFHLSHQSALLKINNNHYGKFFLWDGDRPLIYPKSDHIAP